MLYNLGNTIHAGRIVEKVIDANGFHYDDTVEVDTETGRIVCLAKNSDGDFYPGDDGEAARVTYNAAPPILVVFLPENPQ